MQKEAQLREHQDVAYGVDAPGVMYSLLGFSLVSAMLSALALEFLVSPFWRLSLGLAFLSLCAAFSFLFISFVAYVRVGKFRQRDYMLGRIAWRGDEQVLDIGTGRGLLAIGAAKRLRSGKVHGIDIWNSEDLTGNSPLAARRNAELEGVLPLVVIKDGDARHLDFPDNSIDVVLSLYCLHNIQPNSSQRTACREIARVLKPGGKALVADHVPTDHYAEALADAGLTVVRSTHHFKTALAIMWMVEAEKPQAM